MNPDTLRQYKSVIAACKRTFEQKTNDYGTAWRILRLPSITDQIMIKAQRIRSIQEQKTQRIGDSIETELIGIINYSIIALIQLSLVKETTLEMEYKALDPLYDAVTKSAVALVADKNHDYQEAWRNMRVSSITDIILMRLLRIKRIENNGGNTLISEGIDANYLDIINYAVFASIHLGDTA